MWKVLLCSLALAAGLASAQKTGQYKIPYRDGNTALEGRLVLPEPRKSARLPLVVLYPDWMGVTSRATDDAQRIARWGYAVFVADPYGGEPPRDAAEAGARAGALKADVPRLRDRARAGLDAALRRAEVDTARVAALGFCFGGTMALELARSGAALRSVASIHGNLKTPLPGDARNIRGPVLVLHGAEDPFVPAEEVGLFIDEMRTAGVDWQLVQYGGAVHAFTNPAAGDDASKGAAYHPKAAERAWTALRDFFEETLAPPTAKGRKR